MKDLLRHCGSKESMYYDSPSNGQLQDILEEIAEGLSDPRISK